MKSRNATSVPSADPELSARRRQLLIAGLGAACSTVALPQAHAQSESKPAVCRIGLTTIPKIFAAGRFDGTYDKALGLGTKWITADSAAILLPMLAAGELDITFLGSPAIATAISRKLPVKIIGAPEIINTSECLIARDAVRSVKDLEGKRVAVPSASSMHYALECALRVNKVDKVRRLTLAQPEIVAAWRRGDIDAAYVAGPFVAELLGTGGHRVVSTGDLQPSTYVWNGVVVRPEYAEKYPSTVIGWLRTMQVMYERYKADPDGFSGKLSTDYSANKEATKASLAGLNYPTFEEQLTAKYLGTGQASSPSPLVGALQDAGKFLADLGEIRSGTVPISYVPYVDYELIRRAFPAK